MKKLFIIIMASTAAFASEEKTYSTTTTLASTASQLSATSAPAVTSSSATASHTNHHGTTQKTKDEVLKEFLQKIKAGLPAFHERPSECKRSATTTQDFEKYIIAALKNKSEPLEILASYHTDRPLLFSSDDTYIVTETEERDGSLKMSETLTGDHKYIITTESDGSLKTREVITGQECLTPSFKHSYSCYTDTQKRTLKALPQDNHTAYIWDKDKALVSLHGFPGRVESAEFSPCGTHVAVLGTRNTAIIWNVSFLQNKSWTVLNEVLDLCANLKNSGTTNTTTAATSSSSSASIASSTGSTTSSAS